MGSVNGDRISIDEFNSRVSYYVERFNEQSDEPMPSGMRANFEEQAWEDLVGERLMSQKMDELGITVTEDEIVSMITGDNPDPFIRQQFQDEDGNIDRVALRAAIEAPENREIWMRIEEQLSQNRRQQKLSNYIMSGLKVSNADIEQEYISQNSFVDFEYVRFPYGDISDEEFEVTEKEVRDYYNANKENYQREETYRFRYVEFDKTPTREDTLRFVNDVLELKERFAETDEHGEFLNRNQSATQYRDTFIPIDEIREEYRPVIDLSIGEVSDVHMIDGNPHVFKKVDERNGEIKFAVLSYRVIADPIATIDKLAEEANEFSYFANEDGFQTEAERQGLEVDEATATKGTPVIPGIGQAQQLISQLERMSRNNISDAIELENQFVVVELLEKIAAGPRPFDEVRSQVETVVRNQKRKQIAIERAEKLLAENRELEEVATSSERQIQRATNIRMKSTNIPGAGREPAIIGSVFGLSDGEQSGVLEGENAAFIVRILDLELADPADMTNTQRRQIRRELEQQKFQAFNQSWLEELKKEATIKDNRHIILSR